MEPCLLHHFDVKRKTFLMTDASKIHGFGYALFQEDDSRNKYLIVCNSRGLTDPETRYAPIELEATAIAWSIKQCRMYLLGGNFTVVTDHRPLVGIFRKKDTENPRLRRCLDKVAPYIFDVEWVAGKTHLIADALSRSPVETPKSEDLEESFRVAKIKTFDDPLVKQISGMANSDPEYKLLIEAVTSIGDPNLIKDNHPARLYKGVWNFLSLENDVLFFDGRIIVPQNMRREILEKLHAPHVGYERTKKVANQFYYWPGMNNEIRMFIDRCHKCQKLKPSKSNDYNYEPELAANPMDKMSLDLFYYGKEWYFVLIDRFSGFPFVEKLDHTSTKDVTDKLTRIFNMFGFPKSIRSDNGPQFLSEFREYCIDNNIVHETSSPYYPESNGHAESAVKNMKFLMDKCGGRMGDFNSALLEWRNTPKDKKPSPIELMFGSRRRGILPIADKCKDKPVFEINDMVRIQNPKSKYWDKLGIITDVRPSKQSFVISCEGRTIVRNKRFLRMVLNGNDEIKTEVKDAVVLPRRSPRFNNV